MNINYDALMNVGVGFCTKYNPSWLFKANEYRPDFQENVYCANQWKKMSEVFQEGKGKVKWIKYLRAGLMEYKVSLWMN